jgi:hypothetical protein
MTLKELLYVWEPSFIAVGDQDGKDIVYSGNSKNMNIDRLLRKNVTYIKASTKETSVTIIYVD